MPLKPGDKAPDFTVLDQHGKPFSLKKSLREREVWHLIFFSPGGDEELSAGGRSGRELYSDPPCPATP